jgi:hypothetical protein
MGAKRKSRIARDIALLALAAFTVALVTRFVAITPAPVLDGR